MTFDALTEDERELIALARRVKPELRTAGLRYTQTLILPQPPTDASIEVPAADPHQTETGRC